MRHTDVVCPGCGVEIDFRNMMAFEEDRIQIVSLNYTLKCLKCNAIFLTGHRETKKATKKDIKKMEDALKEMPKK